MTNPTAADAAKARAETVFRQQHVENSGSGLNAAAAAKAAEAEKIARLRALRLAKEEQDRIAAEVRQARRAMRRAD